MKILLVIDQFYEANNGMTISARRFAQVLANHGNEIRVVSTCKSENMDDYSDSYFVQKQYIPIFDALVTAQGMTFAKPDDDVLEHAIAWADVVHFLVPFALSHHGILIAQKLGVPYTAAFHVQPENVTSSIRLGKAHALNRLIYLWFNLYVYQYCDHIHCPSEFIASELRKSGYKAKLHVISNGIDPDFKYRKLEKPPELADRFVILSVGRLSHEKRQDLMIDAVLKSRYRDKIQLILAGKGPLHDSLLKRGAKLPNPVKIDFYTKPDLLDLIARSDLYVHAADAEIEAMSCMEAFAGGLVPVISNSKKSATPQFALDERSLFRQGNSTDLAKKIDYWIEHPVEKAEMEHRYAQEAEKYNLETCVLKAEGMFREAIGEAKERASK